MPRHLVLSLALIITLLQTSFAQPTSFVASKESKIVVSGTSTLHDWELTSREIIIRADIDMISGKPAAINSLNVSIRSESLKSGHSAMDRNTYSTLDTDTYKNITFILVPTAISDQKVEANGTVTVAGVSLPISINSSLKVLPNGIIQLSGSKDLKMSDFNIDAPSFMFGTVRTGDRVTITFDIQLISTNK